MANDGRSRVWLWIVIGGGIFFVFLLAVFTLVYYTVRSESTRTEVVRAGSSGKIAVVDLEGVIVTPKETVKQLKKFADDDSVKAIILHVNSPGGGVAASEEIYNEVRRIRDQKKKQIVASSRRSERVARTTSRPVPTRFTLIKAPLSDHRRNHGVVQLQRPDQVGEAEERGH